MTILETSLLHEIFYGKKAMVFVEMPNRLIEKHYYSITKDSRLGIFPSESEEGLKNPEVRGFHRDIDADFKHYMFKWRWGEPYALPLFSDEVLNRPVATDTEIQRAWDGGMKWQQILDKGKGKKKDEFDLLLILIVIIGLLAIGDLWTTLKVSEKLGVNAFSLGG